MSTPNNQPTPPPGKQFLCKSKGLDWPTPEPGFALWIENGEWFTAPEVDPKKFGPHKWTGYVGYREGQMGNCKCGCYMGSDRSSGPVDPFGACPQNPIAAPITPTFPATGEESLAESCLGPQRRMTEEEQEMLHDFQMVDTTNEKGGEQRQEKCPECGAYRGHSIDCERKTPEEWRTAALQYHKAWLEIQSRDGKWINKAYERSNKMRDLATFWQGKFAILKAENNALRKKLK